MSYEPVQLGGNSVICLDPSSLNPTVVPPQISDFINISQWQQICDSISRISLEANMMSCGGEAVCCCLTGFFPIFCCHPCIYMMVQEGYLQQ